jgi:hypothetical protein
MAEDQAGDMTKRPVVDESRSGVVAEGRDRIAVGGSCARTLGPGNGRDHRRRRRQGDNCRPLCVVPMCGSGVSCRVVMQLL